MISLTYKGFTLIELVIVIIVLGVIGGVAVPAYYNLKTDSIAAAKEGLGATTRTALALAIAEQKQAPTVTQLAAITSGTAVATGVNHTIDGSIYKVPTFTNTACTTATASVSNAVSCTLSPT